MVLFKQSRTMTLLLLLCIVSCCLSSQETQDTSTHNPSSINTQIQAQHRDKSSLLTFNEQTQPQHQTEQQIENENDSQLLDQSNQTIQQGEEAHEQSHYHGPGDAQFWWNVLLALVLTIIGAFCSGMGVGFCNIDKLQLQVMTMSRNPYQRKMAKTIHQVVSNHHLWLVTLLVYNAVALESLPLVIHTLMPDWLAIIFSTIIVLIAAQIVPQAICTGPKKMILAYYASPIVNIMRKILFFIIHPIAVGLDKLLGAHSHQRVQHKDFANFLTGNKVLNQTEKIILTSTLQLRCQRVLQKMISIKKLYTIEASEVLLKPKVKEMLKKDYSHVLVYSQSKDNIVGVIKVKEFATKYLRCRDQKLKAEDVMQTKTPLLSVYKDTNLLQMLLLFQSNSNRIALICDQKKKIATDVPSIMYTKNDMIINKRGAKIIGAIFLYQIFDQLANYQENVPQMKDVHSSQVQQPQKGQSIEMSDLSQPLINPN